jgi:hypothetical protein
MMKQMQRFLLLSSLAGLVLLAVPAHSQKVWEKKPYTEWSRGEALGILTDSPWAQLRFEKVYTSETTTTIMLHSALPIRQALVRDKQIFLNYHKFSAADKSRFDSEVREFLECPDCKKYYMVSISAEALSPLRQLSTQQVKPYVYLANEKGERRALVRFVGPDADTHKVTFVFERFDDQGKPLITITNKKLYFRIEDKLLESKTVPISGFTFEVSKLIQDGVVVF